MPSRGVRRAAGRDEHDRVAVADDDGAVGLLGELAGFESEGLVADGEFTGSHKAIFRISRLKLRQAEVDLQTRASHVYLRMFSRLIRSA